METETQTDGSESISTRVKDKFSLKNVAEDAVATLVVMSILGTTKLIAKYAVKKYHTRREAKAHKIEIVTE